MKKFYLFLIVSVFVTMPSFAGDDLPQAFEDLLRRAKMSFAVPEGYVETEIKENSHMMYEYAVKHPNEKIEVRYAIRPIDSMLIDYEKWKKDPGTSMMADPRNLYPAIAVAVMSNVSAEIKSDGPFGEESVKQEFGADAGLTAVVVPKKTFAGDYKHCMMIAINKRETGTAFCFFMFDDPKVVAKELMPIFHNLRFLE